MSADLRSIAPDSRHDRPLSLGASQPARILLVVGTCILALAIGTALAMFESPAIALAPIVAVVLVVATVRLPGAVFAAFLYIPFYKSAIQPAVPVDITPVLAALCLVLCAPLLLASRIRLPRLATALWTALLALIMIGALYAPDSERATTQAITFLLLVFLPGLLAVRVAREAPLQSQFLWLSVALSFLVTVVGALQLGSITATERLTVLGDNTIAAGRAAMIFPLVGIAMSHKLPRQFQPIVWLMVPLSILVAFSTGSRGPIVMGVLTFVIVTLASRKDLGKRIAGGLALLIGLVFLAQLPAVQQVIPQRSLERMESLITFVLPSDGGTSGGIDTSTSARLRLFDLAGEMFEQRPFFGFGTGSYEWWAQFTPDLAGQDYPHNLLLQFAAEYGLLGLALCVAIIAVAMLRGLRYRPNPNALPLLLLGVFALLNSFVSSGLIDNRWLWGMLVILMALPRTGEATNVERGTARDHQTAALSSPDAIPESQA